MNLTVALLPVLLCVQVDIRPQDRVANRGNSCMWACLDTLGRHNGVKPLIGISQRRSGRAGWMHLGGLPVKSRMDRREYKLLHEAVAVKRQGAIVALKGHAVVVVTMTPRLVEWIDPNDRRVHRADLQEFYRRWNGHLVILGEKKE